jgi:hypothetical protein
MRWIGIGRTHDERPARDGVDRRIGPLAWWSDGEFLSPEASQNYPPAWRNQTQVPSPSADLYALDLLACQMFLGTSALAGLMSGEPAWPHLEPKLKEAGVRRPIRQLLERRLVPATTDANSTSPYREADASFLAGSGLTTNTVSARPIIPWPSACGFRLVGTRCFAGRPGRRR